MRYLRKPPCPLCHQPSWVRYWIGDNCLSSAELSVCDADLIFHRFRRIGDTRGERDIEDLMIVELKYVGEGIGKAQRDTLSTVNALLNGLLTRNGKPIGVESRPGMVMHGKKVVWHGAHLLRAEKDEADSLRFWWDNQPISAAWLVAVLGFTNDPRRPAKKLDIARRHKKPDPEPLFG